MTTQPNPEHLLRRPKKPAARKANTVAIAAGVVVSILVVGAGIGFVVVSHGKSAANSAAVPVAQFNAQPIVQTLSQTVGSGLPKHAGHKPPASVKPSAAQSPSPGPSPQATPTPDATPTPSDAHAAAAAQADAAKAKHLAALHAAALRRLQAAQAHANAANTSGSSLLAGSTSPSQNTEPLPLPTATPTAEPAVATPDAEPTPVYAPRVVVDARFVDRVAPVYPDIAREQGAQGTAIVLATVGPKGNVVSVSLDQSTGNKVLDQSALAAARSSRFQPPEIDGKPATETYRIVYTFDPNN